MVRTIYVVFVKNKVFSTSHLKQYMFLCSNDNVKVGDIIKDPRYVSFMQIVKITPCNARVQEGFTLKDIQIETLNARYVQGSDFDIDKQRNISITLEQAIEWYNSGNETLRTLALTVFTEGELTLNIHYIYNKVIRESICINIPSMEASKNIALAELSILAKYFNKDWKKTPSNTGYFLGQSNLGFSNNPRANVIKGLGNIGIVEHNTVMYPGIVYFREKEDLIKAVKIMGDKAKNLFR